MNWKRCEKKLVVIFCNEQPRNLNTGPEKTTKDVGLMDLLSKFRTRGIQNTKYYS